MDRSAALAISQSGGEEVTEAATQPSLPSSSFTCARRPHLGHWVIPVAGQAAFS